MEKNVVTSKTSAVMVPTKLSNLYASYIDKRQFSSLGSIMWDEFSMHGHYEISGLENFIAAMQQLENYKSTLAEVERRAAEENQELDSKKRKEIEKLLKNKDTDPEEITRRLSEITGFSME